MDRHWLLTWTTYGTWLPGDDRGFVSNVQVGEGPEARHNQPGSECDTKQRGLLLAAKDTLAGPPVYLVPEHAPPLLKQFQDTSCHRRWQLVAAAIMANHVHLLVGVHGDPDPHALLRDFKAYGSRQLNQRFGKPAAGTWWTESGSTRKKVGDAITAAVGYIQQQKHPLLIWIHSDWEFEKSDGEQDGSDR